MQEIQYAHKRHIVFKGLNAEHCAIKSLFADAYRIGNLSHLRYIL